MRVRAAGGVEGTGGESRTFTATARRAQIVRAAIETIAEVGFARASFARITEQAGLSSTRLISYHFAGKDELIERIVQEVFAAYARFVAERMQGSRGAAESLATHIRAGVEFIGTHRTQMKAMLAIFLSGGLHYDAATDRSVVSPIEEILRDGQAAGEFRDFDTRVMATTIQRAIEGLPFLLDSEPDLDLDAYAGELTTLFELATRPEQVERP
jgi:AcrR family transcriptional regulator